MEENSNGLAYRTLMPLANDPHNRSEDNPAIALLAEIKQKIEDEVAEKKAEDEAQNVKAEKAK